jgi:hypothetical protein
MSELETTLSMAVTAMTPFKASKAMTRCMAMLAMIRFALPMTLVPMKLTAAPDRIRLSSSRRLSSRLGPEVVRFQPIRKMAVLLKVLLKGLKKSVPKAAMIRLTCRISQQV